MTHADIAAADYSLDAALEDALRRTDAALEALLPPPARDFGRVHEAMRYAVFAGGKRVRPFLVLEGAALFGAEASGAARAAAAIEMLHTYSLVHDDLPCMDDDDLRRGRPTTHRAFDEATAVLAGDALLTLAFGVLAHADTHPDPAARAELVSLLAEAAGADGMIGGQMMDILAPEGGFDAEQVMQLQRLKTGALFRFACEAGPILAAAGEEARATMRAYADELGLAFQIADDLIDVRGDAATAGKAVGKDAEAGKATLVSLWGEAEAERKARALAESAAARMAQFGPRAAALGALPRRMVERSA